ncbi:hypothetical protein GGX14DRAFT_596713 [Mycena pura]|uniref:Uncharacterized protein n=1 Tax=Mycena pura TaxID=153505 RepID=A0AAD6UTX2_9AGAR|nr:hypothetical protein GGX14DRAFT_596713 [Mycena pura]
MAFGRDVVPPLSSSEYNRPISLYRFGHLSGLGWVFAIFGDFLVQSSPLWNWGKFSAPAGREFGHGFPEPVKAYLSERGQPLARVPENVRVVQWTQRCTTMTNTKRSVQIKVRGVEGRSIERKRGTGDTARLRYITKDTGYGPGPGYTATICNTPTGRHRFFHSDSSIRSFGAESDNTAIVAAFGTRQFVRSGVGQYNHRGCIRHSSVHQFVNSFVRSGSGGVAIAEQSQVVVDVTGVVGVALKTLRGAVEEVRGVEGRSIERKRGTGDMARLSLYPDIHKTQSTWISGLELDFASQDSSLLGDDSWSAMFSEDSDIFIGALEEYLMSYLRLDPFANTSSPALQLHDIENALSNVVAMLFWTVTAEEYPLTW